MIFQQQVEVLNRLGQSLRVWAESGHPAIEEAWTRNRWFTPENIRLALNGWANLLQTNSLNEWLKPYQRPTGQVKRVAVIMAGNIPLVGLHDLICVWISGHTTLVKYASDDAVLMKAVVAELKLLSPDGSNRIEEVKERLPLDFDAVIATGSDNTNRYFDYYFRDKPHILRKNRNSVAVLTGNETPGDLEKLANDIFTYFGLGCRNVSKIYVPQQYDLTLLFEQMHLHVSLIDHHKYANNYTYHKAIFLMNGDPHLDTGFLLVKEDQAIASPLGVLFYETYENEDTLRDKLQQNMEAIQCIVGKTKGYIPFGKAQFPELSDYADQKDTLAFLLQL